MFLLVFPVSPNVSILTQFLLRKPLNCYGVVRRMLKIKPVESSETTRSCRHRNAVFVDRQATFIGNSIRMECTR